MINLNQLRAFYFVAKYSSFTIAAEKLFISQPAVTSQVKLFESYYDIKLFKKIGKKLLLSPTGKLLYDRAQVLFEQEDHMEKLLSDVKELKEGVLELGCTKAYARHIMPAIITVFHRAYPDIKIVLKEGSSMNMIQELLHFKSEVIVVARMDVEDKRIQFVPFSQEEIVVILPPHHSLAKKKQLNFKNIKDEPVIIKGKGSGTRKKVLELYSEYKTVPNIFMESNNTGFIIDLVERGQGISFLVKPTVEQKIKEGKLVCRKIKKATINLDVSFAYIKSSPLSPAANAFYKVLQKSFISASPAGGVGSIMARILAEHPQNR